MQLVQLVVVVLVAVAVAAAAVFGLFGLLLPALVAFGLRLVWFSVQNFVNLRPPTRHSTRLASHLPGLDSLDNICAAFVIVVVALIVVATSCCCCCCWAGQLNLSGCNKVNDTTRIRFGHFVAATKNMLHSFYYFPFVLPPSSFLFLSPVLCLSCCCSCCFCAGSFMKHHHQFSL